MYRNLSFVAVAVLGTVFAFSTARGQAPYYGTKTVQMSASTAWTDTGVDLSAGDRVIIAAWGATAGSPVVEGVPQWFGPDGVADNCTDPFKPFAGAYNMLIGKIGAAGTLFGVGGHRGVTATTSGRLYLGPNDGSPGDNTGFLVAVVYKIPPATAVVGEDGSGSRAAIEAFPNPTTGKVTLAIASNGSILREIALFDVVGRRVRVLGTGVTNPTFELTWDGRNDDGVRVPSGVYFARALSMGGEIASARLVLE